MGKKGRASPAGGSCWELIVTSDTMGLPSLVTSSAQGQPSSFPEQRKENCSRQHWALPPTARLHIWL
jgi:hypothetical protein